MENPPWTSTEKLPNVRFATIGKALVLLRYRDLRAALKEPRLRQGIVPALRRAGAPEEFIERRLESLASMEEPGHTRIRRLALPAFHPHSIGRFRPLMRQVMSDLVDRAAADGSCELVSTVTDHYPIPVICAVLGIEAEAADEFSQHAEAWMNALTGAPEAVAAGLRAHEGMDALIGGIVEVRRGSPADDLLSDLIQARDEGDALTVREIVNLVGALTVAGTDTTRNQLANAVYLFATHPDQWRLLGERPELLPQAVDEVLRYAGAAHVLLREAVEDIDLDGVHIAAGQQVLLALDAANRDPEQFEDPHRFDITRAGKQANLGFGYGLRRCLGAVLAKAEMEEALRVLLERFRSIELAGEPEWRKDAVQGPRRLPVKFVGH